VFMWTKDALTLAYSRRTKIAHLVLKVIVFYCVLDTTMRWLS